MCTIEKEYNKGLICFQQCCSTRELQISRRDKITNDEVFHKIARRNSIEMYTTQKNKGNRTCFNARRTDGNTTGGNVQGKKQRRRRCLQYIQQNTMLIVKPMS